MNRYELELERQRWQTVDTAVALRCKWIPLCFIAYMFYLSVVALAGKATLAQFGIWLAVDMKVNKLFGHVVTSVFGFGGLAYGYRANKLKRENITRMSEQLKTYELKFDQKRSSSRLTKKGLTRPEDTL